MIHGSSMTTLVDLIDATAGTPGSRPSASAASVEMSDTTRWGPAWISTWAITLSRTTRVTRPGKRLRAETERDASVGRDRTRCVGRLFPELEGEPGQLRAFDLALAAERAGGDEAALIGPAPHGVGAHPQQLRCFSHSKPVHTREIYQNTCNCRS